VNTDESNKQRAFENKVAEFSDKFYGKCYLNYIGHLVLVSCLSEVSCDVKACLEKLSQEFGCKLSGGGCLFFLINANFNFD